jgi:hypothetical protein
MSWYECRGQTPIQRRPEAAETALDMPQRLDTLNGFLLYEDNHTLLRDYFLDGFVDLVY